MTVCEWLKSRYQPGCLSLILDDDLAKRVLIAWTMNPVQFTDREAKEDLTAAEAWAAAPGIGRWPGNASSWRYCRRSGATRLYRRIRWSRRKAIAPTRSRISILTR